ncbi:MAG: GNAT family N-acetyltransferase [Pseudorhodoplanes sp.]
MSTYRLDRFFSPRSVAIVGAGPRADSVGGAVLRNMREAGFVGPLHVVNPSHAEVLGSKTAASLRALVQAPDLAVIAIPPAAVPEVVQDAAETGVGAAIVLTAGLGRGPGSHAARAHDAARARGMRLIGPNCLGVIAPAMRLNASFAACMPERGPLALISQSGAVAAGLIEWAARRRIGFSAIASIGDQLDVDSSDLLDFFALDSHTRAILLYIENVVDARKFMSAARAAARTKPVIVMKAGRHAQGARAAATHTGALAGSDAVYDAAFRRAGLQRVIDLAELFDAAQTLSRGIALSGNRLAIVTNGGGLGVLAVDRLTDFGGVAASLSEDTLRRLDEILPATWSRANPIDIIGDAGPDRYSAALEAILADPQNDAVLVINVETALGSEMQTAQAVAAVARQQRSKWLQPKPLFTAWVGSGREVAEVFEAAAIPSFVTESDAVRAIMHLAHHREAAINLMRVPPGLPDDFAPDAATARDIVVQALSERRSWLDPDEVAAVMRAYAIASVPTLIAADAEQAVQLAAPFLQSGTTIALKLLSRDIPHKSDVGGVALGLSDAGAIRQAAAEMHVRSRKLRPQARLEGFIVQPMIARPKARELIVGLAEDPTFGPVIAFGRGGVAVELVADKALALPPLDLNMARDLIASTRVSRVLRAYRDVPAARLDDIALVLVKVAQLAADIPEIVELDINPLLADENGVLALDTRIMVRPAAQPGSKRFAIQPYPSRWERRLTLGADWNVSVRPVRPEDEPLFKTFLTSISDDDLRLRFFAPIRVFDHVFIARLTQIDYARAMAFVALDDPTGALIGVVRLHADSNLENAEYAILLRSDMKGRGLGWKLMEMMIEYARAQGFRNVQGQVLSENVTMLRMCEQLGFAVTEDPEDRSLRHVSIKLN